MKKPQRYMEPDEPDKGWQRLFDLEAIESLLQDSARQGRSISYSEILDCLGYAFTRPKMRSLCVALAEVDRRAAAREEPELAVLVVRASDRIPGAGWWQGRADGYNGAWEGDAAFAHISAIQEKAYIFWRKKEGTISR